MKAFLKATLFSIFAFIGLGAIAGVPEVRSANGHCVLSERDLTSLAEYMVSGPCAVFEQKGFIRKKGDDAYAFTNLALALGDARWETFSQALPKKPQPDYYVDVEVLGSKRRVPLVPGKVEHVTGQVNFAYVGSCLSREDVKLMRQSVLAGGEAKDVESRAAARAPRKPGKGDQVAMRTGSWIYEFDVVGTAPAEDGSVTVTISGTGAGPNNYDAAAAGLCNGYTPSFATVDFPKTQISVVQAGSVDLPLVGQVDLHLIRAGDRK